MPTAPSTHLRAPSPPPVVPHLPSLLASSGKVWGSRRSILAADAEVIRGDTEVLEAKTAQANAFKGLADARIGVALKMCEFQELPERARHAYELGRRDRAHDVVMQGLSHHTAEVNARINLVRAQEHLAERMAALEPPPAEPSSPPAAPTGLTAAQAVAAVNEIAMHLPEMTPEAREHLVLLLSGYFSEKSK